VSADDDSYQLFDREMHREFLEMLEEYCSKGGFLFGDQFDGISYRREQVEYTIHPSRLTPD